MNACLLLAVAVDNRSVTTVEGLGDPPDISSLQQAFIEEDAIQCGYCTPGQLCSATAMLVEYAAGWPSAVTADIELGPVELGAEEIRERMSGNLCRCGAYPNIVAAIVSVSG